jgi:uncharacterized membrane protein YadS
MHGETVKYVELKLTFRIIWLLYFVQVVVLWKYKQSGEYKDITSISRHFPTFIPVDAI